MEKQKLYKGITEEEFVNQYWINDELKKFSKSIGVNNCSKLRKDELEKIIIHYIRTGKITYRGIKKINIKGSDKLELDTIIENYRNNRETKEFILKEVFKKKPGLIIKSGVKYWINRWREDKIYNGIRITYEDLINEFIKLNLVNGRLPQIPSTKMNNFIMDYLRNEINSKRKDAMAEWIKLKGLNILKDYKSWKEYVNGVIKNDGERVL